MDSTTLKSMVIELKDSGMSFQDISNKLERDYGVSRTRQALGALYKRAKASNKDELKQRLISDIVNMYCISDSAVQVEERLAHIGVKAGYRTILDTIKENPNYIKSVQNTIVANIESRIDTISSINDISNLINYKGIVITPKRLNEYFEIACYFHIRKEIKTELSKIYTITHNRQLMVRISEKFMVAINPEEIN